MTSQTSIPKDTNNGLVHRRLSIYGRGLGNQLDYDVIYYPPPKNNKTRPKHPQPPVPAHLSADPIIVIERRVLGNFAPILVAVGVSERSACTLRSECGSSS